MKYLFPLTAIALLAVGCTDGLGTEVTGPEVTTSLGATSEFDLDGDTFTRASGGGFLREGDHHISFAGNVETAAGSESVDWVVQFHSVPDATVNGGTFEATGMTGFEFFDNGTSETCIAAMNMTLPGTFNGESGYSVIFRIGDSGKIKDDDVEDTARVTLRQGGTDIYDSSAAVGGAFPAESSCVGTARSNLGGGNLKLR